MTVRRRETLHTNAAGMFLCFFHSAPYACCTRLSTNGIRDAAELRYNMRTVAGNSQQIARVIRLLLQSTRGKLSPVWMIALVVAAGMYLFFEPSLEARVGFDLPGVHTPGEADEGIRQANELPSRRTGSRSSSDTARESSPRPTTEESSGRPVDPTLELSDYLKEVGRNRFESPAGLLYTPGSFEGHRLKHLMKHAVDDPDRQGQHGVFDDGEAIGIVQLLDEAYEQAIANESTDTSRERNRTVYTVNMGRRIGYIGGKSGSRKNYPAAKHIRIVVEKNRLITAFPVRP